MLSAVTASWPVALSIHQRWSSRDKIECKKDESRGFDLASRNKGERPCASVADRAQA